MGAAAEKNTSIGDVHALSRAKPFNEI